MLKEYMSEKIIERLSSSLHPCTYYYNTFKNCSDEPLACYMYHEEGAR